MFTRIGLACGLVALFLMGTCFPAQALIASTAEDDPFAPDNGPLLDPGKASFWKERSHRVLSFWIDPSGFSPRELDTLRANLRRATLDWENACPQCGLSFPEANGPQQAVFTVRHVRTKPPRRLLAEAFYPESPADQRELKIDRRYFEPDDRSDRLGVLRHEIGHILGYRHEFALADDAEIRRCGWSSESRDGLVALVVDHAGKPRYDRNSIMMYACRNGALAPTQLSPLDIAGHRRLYGN